ncbi:MAG: metallophosphoesterase family protein [Planctomycetota bacterium JB042]
MRIGVISDTHGLLRPEACARLEGVDLIVHAGDIGAPEVIGALETIAPVRAVRGNVDRGDWAAAFPETDLVEAGDHTLYLLHDLGALDLEPRAAGIDVVVSGHSHRPRAETVRDVLYLNPGSAGPRRFRLPIAMATLHLGGGAPRAELHDLEA